MATPTDNIENKLKTFDIVTFNALQNITSVQVGVHVMCGAYVCVRARARARARVNGLYTYQGVDCPLVASWVLVYDCLYPYKYAKRIGAEI